MGELGWKIKKYLGWIIGAIGFVLSLLAGFKLIDFYFADQNTKGLIASWYAFSLVSLLLAAACWREFQTIRKERYANVAPYLHQMFHDLRNVETYMQTRAPSQDATANEHEQYINYVRLMFRDVLDKLTTLFVSLTSTYCRTSIKLTYEREGQLYFYTLTRDRGSEQRHRELDRKRVRNNHDPLNKNRQFTRLFSADEECWHFISNDLTRQNDFSTTSMTAYKEGYAERLEPADMFARIRNHRWPLPYKSTIACAIRQGRFDGMDA
jgi:hypothetical protein